jgi:NADH-quinone oxidoreductase subunit A
MPTLLAYALLFTAIGAGFIFSHLMIGKLVRPKRPDPEKLTVYECGEPTIGSAWVQFDLRFYVVALLFVIFDVEMAFFFPWAVVFGKANSLARADLPAQQREATARLLDPQFDRQLADIDNSLAKLNEVSAKAIEDTEKDLEQVNSRLNQLPADSPDRESLEKRRKFLEDKVSRLKNPGGRDTEVVKQTKDSAAKFGWVAFLDILVFFGVLLVGFAYLWRRGDINWIRSTAAQETPPPAKTEESGRAPLATVV